MAEVRRSTYEQYAWPQPLGALYRHNGLVLGWPVRAGSRCFFSSALRCTDGCGERIPG